MYHHKRFIILILLFLSLLLFVLKPSPSDLSSKLYYFLHPQEGIQCYHDTSDTLEDISSEEPSSSKSIFFHETSCNSHYSGKIVIATRQACAVESAALLNPHFDVYLLFASSGVFKFEGTQSDRMLQALLSYRNVKIRHLNYEEYTKGTPVQELYRRGKLEGSGYAQSHASDLLRYLTLWKYGGIYLDLDVIVTKSLEDLPPNYAGQESQRNVAAGVLSFGSSGIGHQMARKCLEDLRDNFNGHDWGYNGPGVITRLLKKVCDTSEAQDMLNKSCEGFKVYPSHYFYPIPWWNWTMYFDESSTEEVLNLCRNSYAIHVWNKHSVHRKLHVGAKAPYVLFAQQYCPKVLSECDEFF